MGQGLPDYYLEAPGGRLGGRSVEPKPFDARRLGADLDNLHPQYTKAPLNMVVLQSDYRWMNIGTRHRKGIAAGQGRLAVQLVEVPQQEAHRDGRRPVLRTAPGPA